MNWYHKIFVKIDLEVSDAGQIELICLLIACEIARAEGRKLRIGTDCSSAIDVAEGAYSEKFFNILAGWKKYEGAEIFKIDAHPERHKAWGTWDGDDMGIYIADRVAGGFISYNKTVSARDWLIRISARSIISIEEEDGTPFIGSVKQRVSEVMKRDYTMGREEYRAMEGDFEPMWEGANFSHAAKLLERNGGLEDRVTMVKLKFGKRWDVSSHNKATCTLCGEVFKSQRHPLMACMSWEMQEMRQRWKNLIKQRISKERRSLRNEMEEYMEKVFRSQDGELAAVGTYTQRWVNRLNRKREMTEDELRSIKKLMKTVAQGARGMMRTYTRACQDTLKNKEKDKKNRAVEATAELRQLGIKTH